MRPRQVDVWLALRREREPSIKQSVKTWCARQAALKVERPRTKVDPRGVLALSLRHEETGRLCDARKRSLYFPDDVITEVRAEAQRLGQKLGLRARAVEDRAIETGEQPSKEVMKLAQDFMDVLKTFRK